MKNFSNYVKSEFSWLSKYDPGRYLGNKVKLSHIVGNLMNNPGPNDLKNSIEGNINDEIAGELTHIGVDASLAGLSLYGLYKLIRKLSNKKGRTLEDNKKLSLAKLEYNKRVNN